MRHFSRCIFELDKFKTGAAWHAGAERYGDIPSHMKLESNRLDTDLSRSDAEHPYIP